MEQMYNLFITVSTVNVGNIPYKSHKMLEKSTWLFYQKIPH